MFVEFDNGSHVSISPLKRIVYSKRYNDLTVYFDENYELLFKGEDYDTFSMYKFMLCVFSSYQKIINLNHLLKSNEFKI